MSQPASSAELADVAAQLRAGQPVSDARFDALLPQRWRVPSKVHWSPVEACRRAVQLLAPRAGERVLDVGSGPGKFCVIGALITEADFTGVEQREYLVDEAELLAARLGAERARFVRGNAFDLDWSGFQCFYFYNPFAELGFPNPMKVDDGLTENWPLYRRYVSTALRRLKALPAGTRVAVYHELGEDLPRTYALIAEEWIGDGALQLWTQTGAVPRPLSAAK